MRFNNRLAAAVLITLTGSAPAFAAAAGSCNATVLGQENALSFLDGQPFESFHLRQRTWTAAPEGGKFLYIERRKILDRKGAPTEKLEAWSDFEGRPDIAGDIRWGATYLPKPFREFFGFDLLNEKLESVDGDSPDVRIVKIPDFDAIESRLKILERRLQTAGLDSRILKFYRSDEILEPKKYLERFAEDGALPMGTRGNLFEHDLNYHFLASLLMPIAVLQPLRARASAALAFHRFIEKRADRASENPEAREIEKLFRTSAMTAAASAIDLSGNLSPLYFDTEKRNASLTTAIRRLFFGEIRASGFLLHLKGAVVQASADPARAGVLYIKLLTEFLRTPEGRAYLHPDLAANWFLDDDAYIRRQIEGQLDRLASVLSSG